MKGIAPESVQLTSNIESSRPTVFGGSDEEQLERQHLFLEIEHRRRLEFLETEHKQRMEHALAEHQRRMEVIVPEDSLVGEKFRQWTEAATPNTARPPSMAEEATSTGDAVTAPDPPIPTAPPRKLRPRWTRHRDAGRFSYMVGLTGTILFMATGLGPGWLGFMVAYLPASMLAAWATASHA